MLEQYDFQVWLQSLHGDTIVGKTNAVNCPIYTWLCSRGVPLDWVGAYHYWLTSTGEVDLPQWAVDYIALLDMRYATRAPITAAGALALLPTVPAPQRELVAV